MAFLLPAKPALPALSALPAKPASLPINLLSNGIRDGS
jgi:hypothetical protein